ncbi:ribokinase, partial [Candidatus Bipolaricaulota bacterium]|nr:ribokinase [Candidatus Bipolaricaulota bacterium]
MIAVVGSINMDLVIELKRLPRPGETVAGRNVATYPGGKGANQAVAAARLGASVKFFGAVGDDPYGDRLLRELRTNGVGTASVEAKQDVFSGLATIWVDANGENAIALVSGANAHVNRGYIDRHLDRIAYAE